MQPAIDELLSLQRADGGWAELTDWEADAYATGHVLYVLALAGYTADRPEIKRAVDFLVATQKEDGSWPMKSRSTPDGSPGSSKLLTPINLRHRLMGHPRPGTIGAEGYVRVAR